MENERLTRRPTAWLLCALMSLFTLTLSLPLSAQPKALVMKPFEQLSEESKACAACHKDENPSIYAQWGRSKHYGANVGCYECHQASPDDPDAIKHEGYN
ncbi:hydroxylamine oxidoreductase, partial [Vibrio alginolyticus]|nr:hydroxylamine oxidoreductase [Vibrio alginolyticus]